MIKILKATKRDSLASEWDKLDMDYFGRRTVRVVKQYSYKAVDTETNELLGTINGKYESGILYIAEIMVKESARGKGIGKLLFQKAENFCKKLGGHKAWLVTGATWPTNPIYQAMGYKDIVTIPKFYFGVDMKIYIKEL